MRRRKLIEFLNLYVDGEIGPEELEQLEREVSENPEARQLYNQYCRLDEATRQVYRQFRLRAPPESLPDPSETTPFRAPVRRLRRFSLVAGGVAAGIALVSGGLVVFGPTIPETATEVIAVAPTRDAPSVSIASVSPTVRSFRAESSTFELRPTSCRTRVPADWKPSIKIPPSSTGSAPQAWPAYGGIRWNAPEWIDTGFGLSGHEDPRVYRGPERRDADRARPVSFPFRK